jgi:phosphopantetheinyl transferase (holo-ACP synthase)
MIEIGIDIIEINRIAELSTGGSTNFLKRIYTDRERENI